MSALKDQVIEMIKTLPDECSLEDIQYHLYVRAKIERGLRDVERCATSTQDEAEQEVQCWFGSSDPGPR